METFEDEWIRLFEGDNLPIDGKMDDLAEVLPDDPEGHLIPGIKDEWVLHRTPLTFGSSLSTLMEEPIPHPLVLSEEGEFFNPLDRLDRQNAGTEI